LMSVEDQIQNPVVFHSRNSPLLASTAMITKLSRRHSRPWWRRRMPAPTGNWYPSHLAHIQSLYWAIPINERQNVQIKMSLCIIKHYAMNPYGGVKICLYAYPNLALHGAASSEKRAPGIRWIGGGTGLRAGLRNRDKSLAPAATR
jgi:hypothetical protein